MELEFDLNRFFIKLDFHTFSLWPTQSIEELKFWK